MFHIYFGTGGEPRLSPDYLIEGPGLFLYWSLPYCIAHSTPFGKGHDLHFCWVSVSPAEIAASRRQPTVPAIQPFSPPPSLAPRGGLSSSTIATSTTGSTASQALAAQQDLTPGLIFVAVSTYPAEYYQLTRDMSVHWDSMKVFWYRARLNPWRPSPRSLNFSQTPEAPTPDYFYICDSMLPIRSDPDYWNKGPLDDRTSIA